ncbi:E3 ubiquitin-protein ligase RNF13 [Wyeomyia smithii]|uniref:E3 ubiquitin-protein ligase RNF13 n=1 Tax=Wyeomyia smithii TaxID=174621 RepID=UPI002468075B|nr:E3 ubiquitin-protein ligase RNF13 [Wyeomyia smithii]
MCINCMHLETSVAKVRFLKGGPKSHSRTMAPSVLAWLLTRTITTNYYLVILISSVFLLEICDADILVYQNDQLLEEFRDFPATFGGEIPESGLKVRAVQAEPVDGCTPLAGPPENVSSMIASGAGSSRFAVIIARYNCSFEDKIRNAQIAGFAAVIVHNVGSNDLERMSANHAEDIVIPSVFIGESNGLFIVENFMYPLNYALIITDDVPFNINNNLIIPFAIVVGMCFIIMICFMIIRCIRERRRMLRHRLPSSVLKKIPIVKFAKGMQYETCAICLDDYIDNERLRVLPCHHAYHVKCIDPWLTKNRRVCPICKRKVFARGERRPPRRRSSSDSMSSSDADENTPLLNATDANQANNTTSPASPSVADGEPNANVRPVRSERRSNDAHVVNMTSDDDELLDDSNVHAVTSSTPRQLLGTPQRRFNFFDRVVQSQMSAASQGRDATTSGVEGADSPYSPIGEENMPSSTWNRFVRKLRFFHRNEPSPELQSDDDIEPATGETSIANGTVSGRISINSAVAASNNILNGNLSGSFHGEETTDDEIVGASYRDEAKRRQIRSAPNLPSTSGMATGASASGGRLGVAALPNVNFNPSQSGRADPGRRTGGPTGGHYPV